jgi:fumarate reductase flavoprotein subunit
MLDVAEAIVNAALRRRESRGAHQRTDFPARDDQRFLAHSLTYRTVDGSSRVEYLPVKITRWPPGERVYGEVATDGRPHHAAGGALPSREGV